MSVQAGFSNADTGSKPADPYKAKNIDEPSLSEKVEDLSHFISGVKFAMMTTRIASSGLLVSRCMGLAAQESGGIDLLFHTNTESGKTSDLVSDPCINIAFLNTNTGEWASISGHANILTDCDTIKKYYSPALKAWISDLGDGTHDGGPEDPRIGVIRVEAVTVTYAVSRKSAVGKGVEIVKGVVTGEAPAINKLREISTQELEQCRSSWVNEEIYF
ncbi:MAG: BLI-3 blue-light-inducible Bli-3 protein [Cirrosporium novae-zelandiae]|nr:MAG: BLI-3 blue-light-inducible Bli-3 protein [Cirrosporium novae-zelandiae]